MSLVTLDFAKNYLGIRTGADDVRLQVLVDTASQTVQQFTRRQFLQATRTVFLNGTNTQVVHLRDGPVSAATVWLDSTGRFGDNPDTSFPTSTLLVLGTDYSIPYDGQMGDESDSGDTTPVCRASMLRRIGCTWPGRVTWGSGLCGQLVPGAGNIKVTYTAGYTQESMPMTIRSAVCQLTGVLKGGAAFGGILGSESWQGYSYSILAGAQSGQYPELGTSRQSLIGFRRVL